MNFKHHEEDRRWIIEALEKLMDFVRADADFKGNKAYENKAISYQHRFLEDGKYRVVFLGTFNVGKSTAINAFLGGAYLPMDVEECTSQLTFIQRGDRPELTLTLTDALAENERKALEGLLGEIPAKLEPSEDGRLLTISYYSDRPDAVRHSLEPLVTVMADEEYPHLAPLRAKIEELNIRVPASILAEDIVFVDTPGVHTVSETRQEISYGVIERSHLVISFVDSGFAGNIHDLNFVKRIIKWRGRRVFFVLNKADKLETDEIDVRGARGPARSLLQAFKRHDIPEDSEVFFLSGYRALRAQQLDQGHITVEEITRDNKISIPTSIAQRITESDNPQRDLSAYLTGQGRLPQLKDRLLNYLLNENKAGAVIETAARFLWERSDEYAATMENELNLAKDPGKFSELRANRDLLTAKLEEIRMKAERVLSRYTARSKGGEYDGEEFAGYESGFLAGMNEPNIERQVIMPLLDWLRKDANLKEARRNKFKNLTFQMEHQVDEFVSSVMAELNQEIDAAETEARQAIAEQLGQVRGLRLSMTEPGALETVTLATSMTGSYVAFGTGGAAVGAGVGFAVGSILPGLGNAIGAGIGGLIGALTGLLARLAWSEERWLKKLEPIIQENTHKMLLHGGEDNQGNRTTPILESVIDYLGRRADSFQDAVQEELDAAIGAVQKEYDDLLAREEEIKAQCDAIIARLDPKVALMRGLGQKATHIISETQSAEEFRV